MTLSGAEAFTAIDARLAGAPPISQDYADPIHTRLIGALSDPSTGPMDLAVLVRHVLLAEAARRGAAASLTDPAMIEAEWLERAGLAPSAAGRWAAVEWRPDWLPGVERAEPPDAIGAAACRRRFGPDDPGAAGDPFLEVVSRDRYRSVGQRAAIRAALLTPPGETIAVDLPTGEGKSLIFELIDRLPFASDPADQESAGVTLVIVPTVALAYDHENKSRRTPDEVLAYVGSGGDARRAAIHDRLRNAQQGLLFAAPEAACGGLRRRLRALAESGRLKALVVDEAHLVDAWGTGFRTEFQSLSGLRRELIAASPIGRAPRTVLLSATLTPETRETLDLLFAGPAGLKILSASQVRPEPDYWVAQPSLEVTRDARIAEALARLPRPLILYVTEVRAAEAWGARLKAAGYGRFAVFHGRTPDVRRQETLQAWRSERLDLVVATSAFGLGIDYAHVRSVVHACVPETFDRFYQEVGRGGRDGREAVSLIVPTPRDAEIAARLNHERVISVDRGLERWTAMFRHPDSRHLGGDVFRLRLDVAPGQGEDDIDLVGERSLQWNGRILTLLARAGLIRLAGQPDPDWAPESGVYEHVEILQPAHLERATWVDLVEPVRAAISASRRRNLALMMVRLRDDVCPSDTVLELYGSDRVDRVCSRCSICRADPTRAHPAALRREPPSPWSAPNLDLALATLVGSDGRLLVTYEPEAVSLTRRREAVHALEALDAAGVRCIAVLGSLPPLFSRAFDTLKLRPVFVEHLQALALARLPAGPLLVLAGRDASVATPGANAGRPIILMAPADQMDLERPGERLVDRWPGGVLDLSSLASRVSA